MTDYHDKEWGQLNQYSDSQLFELLTLEVFQAGLSWETSLKRRSAMIKAFYAFNIDRVAEMTEKDILRLKTNPEIINNTLKITATIHNAKIIKQLTSYSFDSFSDYMWSFTDGQVINHHIIANIDIPSQNELSQLVSKDMKKRGFKFIGPVIVYSYMQAIGIINDHEQNCSFNPDNF
ncbi:DNA-3-methyladenine glycosylase I [Leuconostoc suionicum]|uniref:DNA-3-methyladenine glycosylase I n=1 Tax=Leuconostoc suionicum TaxID=1511761 RepID=UPI00233EF33D|nr:DNA-3-methyladenine glycosylase I [Leuconostoc suionicum]MDC2806020.1 DNA-3-methyladenine glycosylase I [Leuconostoc suionicum]MDC2823532.1 DNA-3-methyladenine glycosylase I [Leuconostoc suionicum]